MEILWPSKTSTLNRQWMECHQRVNGWRRWLARLEETPLAEKEECPYTDTVSVAHLLGTFDADVEWAIRGKAVFYGAGFDTSPDRVVSPTYQDVPGIYLHAIAYDNLVWLKGNYKRAERSARTWTAVVDVGLLLILVFLWVGSGYVRWRKPLKDWLSLEEGKYSPQEFVDRVGLTILLLVGLVSLIASGALVSDGAVLCAVLTGYCVLKVIWKDGMFLLALASDRASGPSGTEVRTVPAEGAV